MTVQKLCLFCKNFNFWPGEPDWSDITPGYDAEMGCDLHYIKIDMYDDCTESYRKKILTAETCQSYQQIEIADEDID